VLRLQIVPIVIRPAIARGAKVLRKELFLTTALQMVLCVMPCQIALWIADNILIVLLALQHLGQAEIASGVKRALIVTITVPEAVD